MAAGESPAVIKESLSLRLCAASGIAFAAAVALWWLASTRIALDQGSDASRLAAQALNALWFVRGASLALLGARFCTPRGWRPGALAALGLIAPAWPLVVLVWSASTAAAARVVLAESLLLAAALALPLFGLGLRRALRWPALAETAATAVGTALAAAWWLARGFWTLPLT